MSRTYKDRMHRRRFVQNSLYQKMLKLWGDDFWHGKKDKTITKRLRRKLERLVDTNEWKRGKRKIKLF